MAQPKVFVSHSHLDDAFAERLVQDLRAAGADAWLDKEQLGAGDFQERISEALDSCEWFVLVLTRAALASRWVRQEVNAANALKQSGQLKDLIFVQAEPVEHSEVPGLWRVYNILDGAANYTSVLDHVVSDIGAVRPEARLIGHTLIRGPGDLAEQLRVSHLVEAFTLYRQEEMASVICPYCGTPNNLVKQYLVATRRIPIAKRRLPMRLSAVCPNCRTAFSAKFIS